MRKNRVCNIPETRDLRLLELKDMLVNREYQPRMIDSAIQKARNILRHIALRNVVKT